MYRGNAVVYGSMSRMVLPFLQYDFLKMGADCLGRVCPDVTPSLHCEEGGRVGTDECG
jgi:hypothetical protein